MRVAVDGWRWAGDGAGAGWWAAIDPGGGGGEPWDEGDPPVETVPRPPRWDPPGGGPEPGGPDAPPDPAEPGEGDPPATVTIRIYEWRTQEDGRVCPVCGSLHGTRWEDDEGPRPPLHVNCRCERTLVAVEREALRAR